jgi:hypothetical protein
VGWRRLAIEHEAAHFIFAISMTKDTPDFRAVTGFDGEVATVARRGRLENLAVF